MSPPKLSPSYNSTEQSPVRDTVRVRVKDRVRLRLRLRVAQSVARTFDLHAGETVDADAFAPEVVGAIVPDAQRGPAVFGLPAVLVEGHFARRSCWGEREGEHEGKGKALFVGGPFAR